MLRTRQGRPSGAIGNIDSRLTNLDSRKTYASVISGSGSPYGSVTPAAPGVFYIDTAQTLGAREWKSTGTTNTSWVVTDGNTGWRNVTSLLTNGWTATFVLLQRIAADINIYVEGLTATGMTGQAFLTDSLVPGMAPSASPLPRPLYHTAAAPAVIYRGSGWTMSGATTSTPALYGSWSWPAALTPPWPTSLPGANFG